MRLGDSPEWEQISWALSAILEADEYMTAGLFPGEVNPISLLQIIEPRYSGKRELQIVILIILIIN